MGNDTLKSLCQSGDSQKRNQKPIYLVHFILEVRNTIQIQINSLSEFSVLISPKNLHHDAHQSSDKQMH